MEEGDSQTEHTPELDSRREIFQLIRETPGILFRKLLRESEYAQGTLQYHLRWLVEEGLLERSKDVEFTRYYPAKEFDAGDKTAMDALRREYARRIIAHLIDDGPCSTSGLADRIGKSPSTISWHLSRLTEAGVVEKERDGRSVLYSLVDRDSVMRLYTVYQKSFTDRLLDKILGLWDEY